MDAIMPGEGELLSIQPNAIELPFELKKQISCTLHLMNTTDKDVAYKMKTTTPTNFCVRPNYGLLSPHSRAEVLITMQALQETPAGMQCNDRFLVQSVFAPAGTTAKDFPQELFDKAAGKSVHEAKLRVVFVAPPRAPSPLAESAEEFMSDPRFFTAVDTRGLHYIAPDAAVSKEISELQWQLTEARAELNSYVERCHRWRQRMISRAGFFYVFMGVISVGIFGSMGFVFGALAGQRGLK